MDSYFLFVFKGLLSEQQSTLACDHIHSLLPSRYDYELGLSIASPMVPLLSTGNSYVAVLNPLANADSKWETFCSRKELLCTLGSLREPETADTSKFDLTSAHIHELADLLPAYGSYKLDVFVTSDVLETASICDMPVLASALYRLQWWHGARTKVLLSPGDTGDIQSWLDILDATVLGNRCLNVGPSLWRGCVELQSSEDTKKVHCHGFELQLERHTTDTFLSLETSGEPLQEIQQHCVCSPILQVVDECHFASIPPYLLSPMICKVFTSDANCWNEESRTMLEHVASKEGMTLILRMAVTDRPGGVEADRSCRTDRWRRALSSDNVSHPEVPSQFERHITLALTRSVDSGEIVTYALRGVESLDVEPFYSTLCNLRQYPAGDPSEEYVLDLGHLPVVDAHVFAAFIKVLKSVRRREENKSDCPPVTVGAELCLSVMKDSDLQHLSALNSNLKIIKVKMDPSDWKERVVLLHKQMKLEQTKSADPTNALKDPALLRQNVSFSIQEIQERFQPSGEAKSGEPLLAKECVHKSQEDVDSVLLQKWPDALQCSHDGIYYNSDPHAEEKESLGNRMMDLYVRQETAGICGRGDLVPESPRKLPFVPSSELKSFMDRGRSSFEKGQNRTSTEKRRSEAEVRTVSKEGIEGLSSKGRDVTRNLVRKGSAPVRCSPRKKNPVYYGSAQKRTLLIKSKKEKVQNKSNQELPDILRKKLRAAVATALEGQGVQLNDPFFRPCGKRLFAICQAFVQDLSLQKGSMSQRMQKIADAHVKQVIEYERQKESGQ